MNYEPKDASLQVIGVAGACLVFLVVASIGTSTWYYSSRYHGANAVPSAGRAGSFTHGPDQSIGIVVDYAEMAKDADEHLHTYRWVDEKAGIAQIPIDRAMELLIRGATPAPVAKPVGQVP